VYFGGICGCEFDYSTDGALFSFSAAHLRGWSLCFNPREGITYYYHLHLVATTISQVGRANGLNAALATPDLTLDVGWVRSGLTRGGRKPTAETTYERRENSLSFSPGPDIYSGISAVFTKCTHGEEKEVR
jgi:hypothetical protein